MAPTREIPLRKRVRPASRRHRATGRRLCNARPLCPLSVADIALTRTPPSVPARAVRASAITRANIIAAEKPTNGNGTKPGCERTSGKARCSMSIPANADSRPSAAPIFRGFADRNQRKPRPSWNRKSRNSGHAAFRQDALIPRRRAISHALSIVATNSPVSIRFPPRNANVWRSDSERRSVRFGDLKRDSPNRHPPVTGYEFPSSQLHMAVWQHVGTPYACCGCCRTADSLRRFTSSMEMRGWGWRRLLTNQRRHGFWWPNGPVTCR